MQHVCPLGLAKDGRYWHDVPHASHEIPSLTPATIRIFCLSLVCGYASRYASSIVQILDTS